nr:MAG TPA: hypothetical protein [Caudoviricetes sp.]
MKLKEAILNYSGEWVYVGAASGYVYIGKREEVLKGLEKESIERYCNLSINTIPKYEAKMEWVTKRCKALKEKAKTDIAFEKMYKNTEEYKRTFFLRLEEVKKYRDNYVEFNEREVIEEYEQDVLKPFGRVFIIGGNERGNWFYGEKKK